MPDEPQQAGDELTPQGLATYLRAAVNELDMQADIDRAATMLDDIWEQAVKPVPDVIKAGVLRDVAADLYRRRDNLAGNSQFADVSTGQPTRAPRDPIAASWPIIRRYVPGF